MEVFNFILKDLRVIVADSIQHMGALIEHKGMSWVTQFEKLMLLLYEKTVVHESIT